MQYGQENPSKSPDAPRRRVYHPRHPAFAAMVAGVAVLLWLVYQLF